MKLRTTVLIAIIITWCHLAGAETNGSNDGFDSIFDGKSLDGREGLVPVEHSVAAGVDRGRSVHCRPQRGRLQNDEWRTLLQA